ncbi:MAG TPA: cytochrome c [Woeseiaceae bacterium]|jgi:mono/diheme cytochrome c family protein|nr:cytochrome c [Woeseiaceae bacterium]
MYRITLVGLLFLSSPVFAADVAAGKAIYSQTCIACHGANGKGALPGVADFTASKGPLSKTDEQLVTSITEGVQTPGKPLAMPAKGGNPTLTEADVQAVIAYLRAEFGM